ncbi:MAG: hypothetical protein MK098_14795 [Marinovum sp.]|nr:hypothetical protein [Marinovum sp.]
MLILPALIPSWRFFKDVAPSPRIKARIDGSEWREVQRRDERITVQLSSKHLFFNPNWNADLFLVSLSERLIATPNQERKARFDNALRAHLGLDKATHLEWRLSLVDYHSGRIVQEVVFESADPMPAAA